MRTSCNGCRVLRKGCSDDCTIRPCLLWIKSPDAQANATLFLAKFYGRAGLLNLLNAGPDHLRPAIFQSLLYEACGRVVDPVYGSVGLLSSGQWHHCQLAVEAVLKGLPIAQLTNNVPHLRLYDIRHISRPDTLVRSEHDQISSHPRHRRGMRSGHNNMDGMGDEIDVACNSHQSESMSTEEGSDDGAQGSDNKAGETHVGLELTLGFTYDK